jgi:glycosyltransferase involved in cell wall biosynthesis
MKLMRVLIVNRMIGTLLGGGETFDLGVARNLTKIGHNVTIVTARPLFSGPKLSYSDLNIVYLPTIDLHFLEARSRRNSQKLGAVWRYLDRYIFERSVFSWLSRRSSYYDIIQCCSMIWLPRWIATYLKVPVIIWLPGPPSRLMQRILPILISYQYVGLFCHGDPVKILENQLGFVQGADFEVIEPGIDFELVQAYASQRGKIRVELGVPPETVVGVTVARLVPIKNIPFLIRGLEIVVHELGMPVVWFFIGDGPERSFLEHLILVRKLQDHIRWLGQMPQSEVHRILSGADIFALTSSYENFSIATLEAMAHRLPIVATDVGYLKTIVRESGGGILVSPGNVEDLAQAIARLVNDPDYRRQLGENGRFYAQQFAWPNIIAKLLQFYERVRTGRPL